jgi:EmrB/QacA subfamily drug resistance transporter
MDVPASAPRPDPGSWRWLSLGILGFGVALVVVDITVVNVALPTIIAQLDLEIADAEWVNTIYPLVFAGLLLTLGRLGDLWGRRRMFLFGLAVFAGASLAAAQASGLAALVAARAVQGAGAAMILPATLAMVNVLFRGRDRAIAFGAWGAIIAGMAAAGPLLGGWLTTAHGWRWIFIVNVPIAAAAAAGAILLLPESRDDRERGFDAAGFTLATVGLVAVVFALIEGGRLGWWRLDHALDIAFLSSPEGSISPVPIALMIGVATLAAFIAVERVRTGTGRPVLFDLGLFRLKSFRTGNVLVGLVGLGEFGIVFVLPLYLQTVLEYSALRTGVVLVALAAGGLLGGSAAAAATNRIGPRRVVTVGMACEVIGILGVILGLEAGPSGIAPWLTLYGIGVGLASAQLTSIVLAEIPETQSGRASGMQSTVRQVGAALGIALLGGLYAASLGTGAEQRLNEIPGLTVGQRERIVENTVDSAGFYLAALRRWTPDFAPVAAAVEDAITDAARRAALLALAFLTVGLIASLRLPDLPTHGRHSPRSPPSQLATPQSSPSPYDPQR